MADDIFPCRSLIDLENKNFATNKFGNIVKRVEDEAFRDIFQLVADSLLIDPNGTQVVAEQIRLVGGNFIDGRPLLPHIWTEAFTGSGNTSVVDGELILGTGTTADSTAIVESFRFSRFITATFNLTHQAMANPNVLNTDVIRQWGAFNPNDTTVDGVYFENNAGTFSVNRVKDGVVEDTVDNGDFNGPEASLLKIDDNVHIYEIFYNAGTIFFLQDRNVLHKMTSLDSAAFTQPHLKIGHQIVNINGNIVDNTLVSRGSSISRIGSNQAIEEPFHISTSGTFLIKNTPGRLKSIVINDKGAGNVSITVFNNVVASGEIIAIADPSNVQGNLIYDTEFDIGLIVVITGAAVDYTIIFD